MQEADSAPFGYEDRHRYTTKEGFSSVQRPAQDEYTQTSLSPTPSLHSQSGNVTVLPFRENERHLTGSDKVPHQSSFNATEPAISNVTSRPVSPLATSSSRTAQVQSHHWPSLNPLTAYYTPGYVQARGSAPTMDFDSDGTNTGAGGTPSPDQHRDGRAGSVSLDDPDVRLAAEALGDLRADFVSSPSNRSSRFSAASSTTPSGPEPLLSLLTTSHPLLAKTIEGTTSAYNNSKNFSPKFKSGVEYVEGCLTPIGNTLGSVSRVTGVEGGVRWFLSGGRKQRLRAPPANAETGKSGYHKRRKVNSSGQRTIGFSGSPELQSCAVKSTDLYTSARSDIAVDGDTLGLTDERRLSMSTIETLPAYDDHTSPAYTESDGLQQRNSTTDNNNLAQRVSTPNAWQSRLIMSTSGLSIAMSEESLRSLKFCLNWLRWANDHIGRVISALKSALEQYESVSFENSDDARRQTNVITANTDDSQIASRSELAARIATLKGDVLQTLRGVIDTVSKYAGGALPDNAKVLVRRHLTSLPQRFRLATSVDLSNAGTETSSSDAEVKEGAQRVLVLAKEGLDMMSQVSGVLDGTIVSAEEWCERLGKKKRDERGLKANHAVDGSYVSTESSVDSAMK